MLGSFTQAESSLSLSLSLEFQLAAQLGSLTPLGTSSIDLVLVIMEKTISSALRSLLLYFSYFYGHWYKGGDLLCCDATKLAKSSMGDDKIV